MTNNTPDTVIRRLTETYLRGKIRELKNDPERGIRNLIDLALNLSSGRFQQNFFLAAQTMLQNQQSSYYRLIQDVIFHVNEEHLVTFGMNVGYNSLTYGAKRIRATEDVEGFNIPWVIALSVNGELYDRMEGFYQSLLDQGTELGVYSWILHAESAADKVLPLIKAHSECAFMLIISASEATDDFLTEAELLHNLILSVKYDADALWVYSRMRERKMLYSACIPYNPNHMTGQMLNDLLSELDELHPILALFVPASMAEAPASSLYDEILALRQNQKYAAIPLELYCDARWIDGIISTDACTLAFDENGDLYREYSSASADGINFCSMSLQSILKKCYPKTRR